MQNSAERPDLKAKGAEFDPIAAGYVRFEDQSLWMRHRPWIWAAIIMLLVVIGFAAIVLPQFAIGC
ncbi:MAG TPA: hypothetical protein VI282_12755 [Verrucomicrobiae bacterium]|jgi:hypothetical protein